jgi:hypothetical protein
MILLVDPWVITAGPQNGIPLEPPVDLQVANPLCFMVQELLIKKDRKPAKHAQDLLYIYDTISLFGHLLPLFKDCWNTSVHPALGDMGDTVAREWDASFAHVTDAIRQAALIPADRKLSPEELQATCRYAFDRIVR